MIKEASQKTVAALFSRNDSGSEYRYLIPAYQREYSWKEEQWDNLFNDIYENDRGYFLGSIICILPDEKDSKNLDVIDGQQRLTTLSLLLLSLYNKLACYSNIIKENDNDFLRYIGLKNCFTLGNELRIRISIQNDNLADYEYLIRSTLDNKNIAPPKNFGNRRISKAFRYFERRIEELLSDNIEENESKDEKENVKKLFSLLDKISSALIVKIDTEDAASAFILFESINNRGMPLTPIDLIKNNLISKLGNSNPEDINKQWQSVVHNLNDYDAQVRFLRHYYNAFSNVKDKIDIKVKDVFNVTKSGLLKVYVEIIRNHKEEFLNDIINKSNIYQAFVNPFNIEKEEYHKYKDNLVNLFNIGSVPSNALLLFLFNKYPNEDFSQLLHFLEKWFIIRHITNKPSTNKLDNLFIDIIKSQKDEYNFNLICKKMLEQFDPLNKIKEDMIAVKIYEHSPKLTKCLLVHIEQLFETKESKKNLWEHQDKNQPTWTVEHIYPQKPNDDDRDTECDELIDRIGNLTLTAYNGNLSNRSFTEKLQLEKDGKEIGFNSGNIKINELVKGQEIWKSTEIENRSEWLVDQFLSGIKPLFK